jgi:hypothetical protein
VNSRRSIGSEAVDVNEERRSRKGIWWEFSTLSPDSCRWESSPMDSVQALSAEQIDYYRHRAAEYDET